MTSIASDPLTYIHVLQRLADLWFDIDHHAGAHAHEFFTPDAELRFRDGIVIGRRDVARVYAERASRGPRVSRHLVTNLHLEDVRPMSVRATSSLLLFGEDGHPPRPTTTPTMVGDVRDDLELHAGHWLIRSRWIQYLFIAPETRLAVPDTQPPPRRDER